MLDVLIRNGWVVDGTGGSWFKADIGIEKGKITEIGDLGSSTVDEVINARKLMVSPGFIDIHAHSDTTLLINGRAESKIRQGITTEVNGNCGSSAGPIRGEAADRMKRGLDDYGLEATWTSLGEYFNRLTQQGTSVNVISFVGHTTIRQSIIGNVEGAPTDDELQEMKLLVEQAMQEGAIGLSTGLEFAPGGYAQTNEIIELCKVIAEYGGIYTTHQRNRDTHYEQATTEAIEIGEKAGVQVHLSHFVVRYPAHDKTPALLWMVDQARHRGIDVTFDVIIPNDAPQAIRLQLRDGYHWAGQSLVQQLIPPWALEGDAQTVLAKCRDPAIRARFRTDFVPQWKLFGCPKGRFRILGTEYHFPDGVAPKWDRLLLNNCRARSDLIGKTFDEIARMNGLTDPWDSAMDVVVAEIEKTGNPHPRINILGATTAERDSIRALKHHTASITTDRSALAPYGLLAEYRSPNSYGAFARVFRKYVRERGIFTYEEAVRKMTSLPANSLGLYDLGILRVGARADIVIFDPEQIADNATIEQPNTYAEGIKYVLVNGEITIEQGEHTGCLAGIVKRGPRFNSSS